MNMASYSSILHTDRDSTNVFVVVNGNGERQENDSSSDDDDEPVRFIDNSLHRFPEDNVMEVGDIKTVMAAVNNPPSFRRGAQPAELVAPTVKKPRVMSVKEQHCIASKFHYWTDEMVSFSAHKLMQLATNITILTFSGRAPHTGLRAARQAVDEDRGVRGSWQDRQTLL
jgi:hypothetical protein